MPINVKNVKELDIMRKAGEIVALTHERLRSEIMPGVSTFELDRIAHEFIKSHKATPSFLKYNGYPASICTSINEEVVHGIPSKKRLLIEGDIVSVDIGAYYEGFHGDAARTWGVGSISSEAERLIKVTEESFFFGIENIKEGSHLYEISVRIQEYAETNGYSVVRDLTGHGIGKKLHEEPQIPNFKVPGRGPKLSTGMTLAIEPMINQGTLDVKWLDDKWTVVTADKKLSAHYENTVAITKDGYILLTVL